MQRIEKAFAQGQSLLLEKVHLFGSELRLPLWHPVETHLGDSLFDPSGNRCFVYDDTTLTKIDRKRGKGSALLVEANKFKAVLIQAASAGDTLLTSGSANLIESLNFRSCVKIFGDVHRKKNSSGKFVRRRDNPQDYSLPELEPQLILTRQSLPLGTSSKSTLFSSNGKCENVSLNELLRARRRVLPTSMLVNS